jgi:hypothetical protein
VTGAFTLEKKPAKKLLLQHEVAETAKKCSFHNASQADLAGPALYQVVERGFAWLERRGRPWKNCELLLNTSLQFVPLAFLLVLLRKR